MPAASTGYEVVEQAVPAVANPGSNLVQLNAPSGTVVVNAFAEPGYTAITAGYGFDHYVISSGVVTGAVFRPGDSGASDPGFDAHLVCVGA